MNKPTETLEQKFKREKDEQLLILLQEFNDYDNPIQMDAQYVRNKLIEVFKKNE